MSSNELANTEIKIECSVIERLGRKLLIVTKANVILLIDSDRARHST